MLTPPTVLGTRDSRKSPLAGLSIRRTARRSVRDDLVAHGDKVVMLCDQLADIVALERYGEPGEGPVTEMHDENVAHRMLLVT